MVVVDQSETSLGVRRQGLSEHGEGGMLFKAEYSLQTAAGPRGVLWDARGKSVWCLQWRGNFSRQDQADGNNTQRWTVNTQRERERFIFLEDNSTERYVTSCSPSGHVYVWTKYYIYNVIRVVGREKESEREGEREREREREA